MPTYKVTGINVGSFNLGESDKVLTIFSAERGLIRAVAKGARKPGSKIAGRADLLNVNSLMLSTGRSLDIVTQAESLETFPKLRHNLLSLSYGFYFAELTQQFGQGLSEESRAYFDYLCHYLHLLSEGLDNTTWLTLQFELGLLEMVGYKPELTYCVVCREVLTDYKLGAFGYDLGGIICQLCWQAGRASLVAEACPQEASNFKQAIQITPLVWKNLVLASHSGRITHTPYQNPTLQPPINAAHQLVKGYIEHKAGRQMKSLKLLCQMDLNH